MSNTAPENTAVPTTNDNSTYSSLNLESDDFQTIFHNLGMSKTDAKKISNEHGEWCTFIAQYHEDTPNALENLKISQKSISISMFARYKVLFENSSLHDIANMKLDHKSISIYHQRMKQCIVDDTVAALPKHSKHAHANTSAYSTRDSFVLPDTDIAAPSQPHIPPHKQIIKDIANLSIENTNVTDLMKNVVASCKSLSGFLTFYQTLQNRFVNCNIFICPPSTIDSDYLSEPDGLLRHKHLRDLRDYLSNAIHSFLSKEGTFKTEFKEGHQALSRTSDGCQVLNQLLLRTHAGMQDVWACQQDKPKFSNFNDIDEYSLAMQHCIKLESPSDRDHTAIEQSRMFLSTLDDDSYKPIAHSLLQELRTIRDSRSLPPNMHLMMLPGAIDNHHLKGTTSTRPNNHNNNLAHANVANLDSSGTPDVEDIVINSFRNFNINRKSNFNNCPQQSPSVKFNRSQHNRPFKGKCNACGRPNYHSKDCAFLQKLLSCLTFMEKNNISPSQVHKYHRMSNTHQNKSNIARSLADDNFIPYDNVDPEAFINVIQEDQDYVLLDDPVDEE